MPEYNIKVQFEQKTFSFSCSEDQDIISAAKMNGIDLPSSVVLEFVQIVHP